MILIFEHDTRDHGVGRFDWRVRLFRNLFHGRRTWKIGWGFWSISYYGSRGLREFFDRIESGATEWVPK